ncbi:hypothetical protein J4229_00440 [Candidatus Pacearchaeota archaeon]|nr:hypothetical protein [Candidatus Pacearchaeota archaeon]
MTKALIFDSGTLINLSMNGLLDLLTKLKEDFDGKFMITKEVKYEVVDRPIGIYRFELGALRVQNLIDLGILELPSNIGISDELIKKDTKEFGEIANHSVQVGDKWVNIVSDGEMSCLALSKELTRLNIKNIIAIDERTTRVLSENPESMERIMSEKIHKRVHVDEEKLGAFSKFKFIRSSEIVYSAYKKGLTDVKGKKALEALLYATRFKGAAISFEEIDILKKM